MHKVLIKNVKIEYSFYFFAAVFILLLPLKLVLAWTFAVLVHEVSHYIALRVFGVDVVHVSVSAAGIKIETGEISGKQELICALAGPFGGCCLLFAAHWMPYTAICAFIHSVFNLLPIYPLDGGRAFHCIMCKMLGHRYGNTVCIGMRNILTVLLLAAAVVLVLYFNICILPVMLVILLFVKFKLANESNK